MILLAFVKNCWLLLVAALATVCIAHYSTVSALVYLLFSKRNVETVSSPKNINKKPSLPIKNRRKPIFPFTLQQLRVGDELSLAYHKLWRIPNEIVVNDEVKCLKRLDLTECGMKEFGELKHFSALETLVLDKNDLVDFVSFPKMPSVKTLWCNNNKFLSVKLVLLEIERLFPNLVDLSMLCNPGIPDVVDLVKEAVTADCEVDSIIINSTTSTYGDITNGDDESIDDDVGDEDDDGDDLDGDSDSELEVDELENLLINASNDDVAEISDDEIVSKVGDDASNLTDVETNEDEESSSEVSSVGPLLNSDVNGKYQFYVSTSQTSTTNAASVATPSAPVAGTCVANTPPATHAVRGAWVSAGKTSSYRKVVTTQQTHRKQLDTVRQFRIGVVQMLPKLQFFNGLRITKEERKLAKVSTICFESLIKSRKESPQQTVNSPLGRESLSRLHSPTLSAGNLHVHFGRSSDAIDANNELNNFVAEDSSVSVVHNVGRGHRHNKQTWHWPVGYSPPIEWTNDVKKRELMEKVQQDLDDSGVDYHELAAQSNWCIDNRIVARYLGAAQWEPLFNGVPIHEAILETLKWRAAYPIPFKDQERLVAGLSTGCMRLSGVSRDGKPVLYVLPQNDVHKDFDRNVHSFLYCVERAVQRLPLQHEDIVVVLDCSGIGFRDFPPISTVSPAARVLSRHIPRRLGKMYLVNVNMVVQWIYEAVAIYLSEVTKKKLVFAGSSPTSMMKAMGESIDASQIPSEYGGSGSWEHSPAEFLSSDSHFRGVKMPLYS